MSSPVAEFPVLRNTGEVRAVNITGTGPGSEVQVWSGTSGKRWQIHFLFVEVGGATDITWMSGTAGTATALSGVFAGSTSGQTFSCGGAPVLKASAVGEGFVALLSANVDLDGWAYVTETDR